MLPRSKWAALAAALVACSSNGPPPTGHTCQGLYSYGALTAVSGFSNPAGLNMYEYVPAGPLSGALVVALHGCTQSADAYQRAGWSAAADAYGFVVLYPEQTSANNQNKCFNWFIQEDTTRNGEALTIANAIQQEISAHSLDARRVYVTGLSAGAAMTAVLLANYPDKGTDPATFHGFAAGQINAGLPYRAACTGTTASTCPTQGSYGDAFTAMEPGKTLTPVQWGDRVRDPNPGNTVWPRVTIWQGSSDSVVNPVNLSELMKQWTDVWGVSQTPTTSDTVAGFPHDAFKDPSGATVVETYQVTGMDHGTAIDTGLLFGGLLNHECGTAGAYILDKKICSTYYALAFWGELPAVAPTDAGGPTSDGGAPADAGGGVADAGAPSSDGGPSHPDAGSPAAVDAGIDLCATVPGDGGSDAGAPDAAVDVQAPVVTWLAPAAGSTLSGSVNVVVSAVDNVGVAKVTFAVDGTQVATAAFFPYGFAWDTTQVANGPHQVKATAADLAGNLGQATANFTVQNDAGTCVAITASNYAHVQAGRAHDNGGNAYANGSNAPMGLDNVFYATALHPTGPNYWVIGPCP